MENNNKETKTVVFRPELSGFKGKVMNSIFFIIIGIVIYYAPKPIELASYIKDSRIYLAISALFCFVGIVSFLKLKIYIKSNKYVLTSQRLSVEQGFMSKKISNLELWRIVDIELKQSALEFSTGGCTIVLTTQDLSDPMIYIKGLNISNGKKIYETLTNYIALATKSSGVTRMM